MCNTFRFVTVLLACGGCIATAAAQTAPLDPAFASAATCRQITAQAQIDGRVQNVTGLACLQSDGTWQMVQDVYAPPEYAPPGYAYGWYDPWYWGPPIGFGTAFFFVDRDHHRHHLDHVFVRHAGFGAGFHRGDFDHHGMDGHHGMGGQHGMGGMGGLQGGMRHR
jgi:surface antigen